MFVDVGCRVLGELRLGSRLPCLVSGWPLVRDVCKSGCCCSSFSSSGCKASGIEGGKRSTLWTSKVTISWVEPSSGSPNP